MSDKVPILLRISENFFLTSYIAYNEKNRSVCGLERLDIYLVLKECEDKENKENLRWELKQSNGEIFSILEDGNPTYLYRIQYGFIVEDRENMNINSSINA